MSIPANEILKYIQEVRSELDAPARDSGTGAASAAPSQAPSGGSTGNKFTGPYPTRFSPRSKTIEEIYGEKPTAASVPLTSNSYHTRPTGLNGIFDDIQDAIEAAWSAQKELAKLTLERRGEFVEAMRKAARANAEYLGRLALEETGYGHLEHKTAKNLMAANKTPGIEDLYTIAKTGDNGMMLTEMAPFGVIGAITPSTNPTGTIINNSIGMIAAGNAVVFNPHPAAKRCCIETIKILNRAIVSVGGPDNLMCSAAEPTMDTSAAIMSHPKIRLLVVTGGEAVVNIAMKSGKRTIGAGPGNPPVLVDETADIAKAARDIMKGIYFENCILCIAEKEILVVDSVADELIHDLVQEGAYLLNDRELQMVMDKVIIEKDGKYSPNKAFVGRDASYILEQCGITGGENAKAVIAETPFEHPLVMTEMLMPVVPVTRVRDVDDGIEKAVIAENNCHHTACMHSTNVYNMNKMGKAVDTTIFVKNAPSYAGLGYDGEGYATLTIATPTGEGLTSAKNFTRSRRCTLSDAFRII